MRETLIRYERIIDIARAEWEERIRQTYLPNLDQDPRGQLAELAVRIRADFHMKRVMVGASRSWWHLVTLCRWSAGAWTAWLFLALATAVLPSRYRAEPQMWALRILLAGG